MAFTWPELVTLLRRLGYYLITCQSLGHTPEKPCKGSFNVRVGHDLHLAAALAATRKKVTLNDLTRQALSDFLHHHSADACPAIS
ncbi:toxin-antitoxin system HicB family antitoxin [Pseudomonas simiae]|uniref:toxin-antitoxin system HicB family antitoxin n=1 Tax=Pseudomonas simiae TaxID=321846 RepID=UPI003315C4B4